MCYPAPIVSSRISQRCVNILVSCLSRIRPTPSTSSTSPSSSDILLQHYGSSSSYSISFIPNHHGTASNRALHDCPLSQFFLLGRSGHRNGLQLSSCLLLGRSGHRNGLQLSSCLFFIRTRSASAASYCFRRYYSVLIIIIIIIHYYTLFFLARFLGTQSSQELRSCTNRRGH